MPSAVCTFEHWLQLISGALAALAAIAWLRASWFRAPRDDDLQARWDVGIPAVAQLVNGMRRQSRWNAVIRWQSGGKKLKVPVSFPWT